MAELNLISVSESSSRELTADGAEIVVRIAGQSFFTGQQAFEKAKEVADCTAALTQLGLAEDAISLLSVLTEVETGLLTKSSSAIYHLMVKLTDFELLGPVLAAISAQKNALVESVDWQYSELECIKREVLHQAVKKAKSSAEQIAEALSATLAGVHRLSYKVSGLETEPSRLSDLRAFGRAKARQFAESDLAQMSLSHKTRLTVSTSAEFLVADPQ
ncbi:SIMPL domain-containing protein [Aeoliella sp.]|uniref:SIMPL domain-containing protein n=1 Tax=Aeoliella sp. TaxID=2795800 RepID=UPI003CCBF670